MTDAARELSREPGVAPREYRDLMGCFATGVTVLTVRGPGGDPAGVTVNSVTSVSLDPPVLLVCLHRDSSTRAALEASGEFVLNVLAAHQEELSRRFASSELADRFESVTCEEDPRAVPVLTESAARIGCRVVDEAEVGDHVVYYALVTGGRVTDRPPLLFCRGKYHSLEGG